MEELNSVVREYCENDVRATEEAVCEARKIDALRVAKGYETFKKYGLSLVNNVDNFGTGLGVLGITVEAMAERFGMDPIELAEYLYHAVSYVCGSKEEKDDEIHSEE